MSKITCTDCNETTTDDDAIRLADDRTLCNDCASSAYDIYTTID